MVEGRVIVLVSLLAMLTGCVSGISDSDCVEGDLIDVVFSMPSYCTTKSSISANVDKIIDYKIFAYRKSKLEKVVYASGEEPSVTMKLVRRGKYDFYALANVGDVDLPSTTSAAASWRYQINAVSELNSGIPMAWSKQAYTVPSSGRVSLNVSFDRLVAELSFSLDPGVLSGLSVTSVRLRQSAASVAAFSTDGSRAEPPAQSAASAVLDGDFASASDLAVLNSGGAITLYSLENCQGVLLSDNTDPMLKVPDNIGNSDLCTYLEIVCNCTDASVLDGKVTYRLFPGEDSVTDFTLRRNRKYSLQLYLTPDGLDEVSWRVTNESAFRSGLGTWSIVAGLHDADEMYIGESLKSEITLDDRLVDFLGDKLLNCSVILSDGQTNSSAVTIGDLYESSGHLYCDLKGESPLSAQGCNLFLCDPDGRVVTNLSNESIEDVRVNVPVLAPSTLTLSPSLNGVTKSFNVYVRDKEGNNLNSSSSYGFDLSYFSDLTLTKSTNEAYASGSTTTDNKVKACHYISKTAGKNMNDGPLATYKVQLVNSGTDATMNREFSRLYGIDNGSATKIWKYTLESNNAENTSVQVSLDIQPLSVIHYGALTTSMNPPYTSNVNDAYIAVSNPSKITLNGWTYYSGYSIYGLASLSGCTDQLFMTNDSAVPNEIVGSRLTYVFEPVSTLNIYTVEKDGLTYTCYPVYKNTSSLYGSVSTLFEKVKMDMSRAWSKCQSDIVFKTTAGRNVPYYYSDLYDATTNTSDGYVMTERKYYGSAAWSSCGTKVADEYTESTFLGSYSSTDLESIYSNNSVTITLKWVLGKGAVLSMSGNTYGATFTASGTYTCTSKSSWQKNSSNALQTQTYTVSYPVSTTLTGTSATNTLLAQSIIDTRFEYINRNYWHESCTRATNTKGHRFASLAMPVSVSFSVKLTSSDPTWVPITLTVTSASAYVGTSIKIYSRTAEGTYPSTTMKNPDGSSRGDDSAIDKTATAYSDYTQFASPSYTFSGSFTGYHTFHKY